MNVCIRVNPEPGVKSLQVRRRFNKRTLVFQQSFDLELASAACGLNAIAQQAAGDSATSPSSLFCSVANSALSIVGTLRAALADQTYVFADGVHPTTQMHKVLAQYVREKMGGLLVAAIVP